MTRHSLVFNVSLLREALAVSAVQIHRFYFEMRDAMYRIALVRYRTEVGSPPGSDRTCRLRKKRRKAVMDYYYWG